MGHYEKKTKSLSSLIEEENRKPQSPTHLLSFQTLQAMVDEDLRHHFSPTRTSSAPATPHYALMPPPSPDSPWTLSPHQTPSHTLLYHCIASLHRQDGNIYAIAASRGLVFTGSNSRRIRVWHQPDCAERGYLKASSGEVRAMLFHGNMLFTSHKDFKIRIWNVTNSDTFRSTKVKTLPKRRSLFSFPRVRVSTSQHHHQQLHRDHVSCMAYYLAEDLLYSGSWDKTVKVWRVSDGSCVDSFIAHEENVNAILVNQDDGCLFTSSSDGSVRIWRRVYGHNSHTLTMTLKFQQSPVNALALSTSLQSCFLYSGSSDGYINFWEKEKLSSRFNHGGFLQGHRFSVQCLVAVDKMAFSGSEDTTIRVWKREEGSYYHECLAVLDGHRGPVRCLAALLEMETIVMSFLVYSASLDQTFKVWRVRVLPEENKMIMSGGGGGGDGSINGDVKMKLMGYDMMSPVLSPSWVEKKIQTSTNHHQYY